jgi:hypothetical protein
MKLASVKSALRRVIRSTLMPFYSELDVNPLYTYSVVEKKGYHCFVGYYDLDPIASKTGLLLYHRIPSSYSDQIEPKEGELRLYRVQDKTDRFLASTRALNWQLASRAQWLTDSLIIFNDIEAGFHCSKILEVDSGSVIKTFSRAVWAISSDKTIGASLNFSRISKKRPGYGYRGNSIDGSAEVLNLFSLIDGELVYSITLQTILRRLGFEDLLDCDAYMNHVAWSDSATKFLLLFHIEEASSTPRMNYPVVIDYATDRIELIHETGFFSHYLWLQNDQLLAFTELDGKKCYAIWHESTGWQMLSKSMPQQDGHPSLIPNTSDIVVDGYPNRFGRMPLYLGSIDSCSELKNVAMVTAPVSYSGALRCDLHPRVSTSEELVICDMPAKSGRKILMINGVFGQK